MAADLALRGLSARTCEAYMRYARRQSAGLKLHVYPNLLRHAFGG